MSNALELKNITMNNNGFLLRNVDFTLPLGSVLGLVGRNGVGKTTLVQTILGGYTLEEGEVVFFDHQLDMQWEQLLDSIAYIGDSGFANPYMKIKKSCKEYKRVYPHFDEQRFQQFLEMKEISLTSKFNELSLGQGKLVELYMALSRKAKILFLDEPMANLDPIARKEIIQELHTFMMQEDHTVVISSHILSDLEKIADYVAFMEAGEIILFERMDRLDTYHTVCFEKEAWKEQDKTVAICYKESENTLEGLYCLDDIKEDTQRYQGKKADLETILAFISEGKRHEKTV